MYTIKNYQVVSTLPENLEFLKELAYNLYWSWDHESRSIFRRLDPDLWEASNRNPIVLLGQLDQEKLQTFSQDEGFLAFLNRVQNKLSDYMERKTWYSENIKLKNTRFAYFSMEFGLANGLPIYSGGLGILAGDHLKSASDLGIPLVGVGLLYQQGYFQQYLARDGWQQETYPLNDFYNLPVKLERDENGEPVKISVDYPEGKVYAQIWRCQVGRVPLYLLDTNIQDNDPQYRTITAQLYGGDNENRIKQELLLGIGGVRALDALGIRPDICHMNEGHSAFLVIERLHQLMQEQKMNFSEATEAVKVSSVFTTHTPVPAGIDEFDIQLMDTYLGSYIDALSLSREQFYRFGGTHFEETGGKFNMAIFAINFAGACNGVSKLHGQVARDMWHYLWPELPKDEVPIGHVTNGVHIRSWISEDMAELFSRYLGPYWYRNPLDESQWPKIDLIPDEELWRTHERRRERLVAIARNRLHKHMVRSGASKKEIEIASEVLDPEALTIGFARRFAQYKRAYLLFKDTERLDKILNNKDMPVQIIFAGKAHPRDKIGKGIIQDITSVIRQEEFRHKIVFLENYDITLGSYLVQGVDVWLNNPRRPREASGTSGMKAGANGALNLSILDGWWDEAYNTGIGWAIGQGEEYSDTEEQDLLESAALYHLLENDVIPTFYRRSKNNLPRDWISMMKNIIKEVSPVYNTNRMVREYLQKYYQPSAEQWFQFSENNFAITKGLSKWKSNMVKNWNHIKIVKVTSDNFQEISVGDNFSITATLDMKNIKPQDVNIEIYYGRLDSEGEITAGETVSMKPEGTPTDSVYNYKAEIPCNHTGQHGFSLRVLPFHENLKNPHEMGLITWYKG